MAKWRKTDPIFRGDSAAGVAVPPTARHRIVYQSELPCRPCYHQFRLPPCPYERACLTHVEPSDVLDACEAVLSDAA